MYPTLLSFGKLEFHAYAVFLALAFLTAVLLIVRENYKRPNPYPITPIGGLWVFLGAMFGARIYYIIQYEGLAALPRAVYLWEGGLVFYGGLFGGILGGIVYLLFCRVPLLPMGDIAMPFVPLAHSIARVGCFLNGCCWGSPCDYPWAVHYPRGTHIFQRHLNAHLIEPGALKSAPLHPTQLYSAASLLVIFFVMRFAYKRNTRTGAVLMLYPLLYGIHRFIMEMFRGDSARPVLGLTVSQCVALGFVAFSLAAYSVLSRTVWPREQRAKLMPEQVDNGLDLN